MAEIINPALPSPTAPVAKGSSPQIVPPPGADPRAPISAPGAKTETAPKQDERVSGKLQTLVTREKTALEAERTAKAAQVELDAKIAALSDREKRIVEFETLKATNPLKALELLGLNYQELTQIALNDGQVPAEVEIKKVRDELKSYVSNQEAREKKAAEDAAAAATAQEAQITEDFQRDIESFVTIDPKTGYGKILSIEQAADIVEADLQKKYDSALGLEKFKSRVIPVKKAPTPPVPANLGRKPQPTLTNHMSATPTKPRSTFRTDDERVRDAIAYAQSLRSAT